MIHLFVDGDYFLTGVTPSTEADVRECVQQIHDAINEQLFLGTPTPVVIEQRVVFFSSAILKSLEEQQQREVLIATLRRLRFQTMVLDTIAGRAGSPVDSAICTKTMSMLTKATSASNSMNNTNNNDIKSTTFVYFSSNAYISSALEWAQSVGCGVCFVKYNGDSVADELLAYVSSKYGRNGGIATIPKGQGVEFVPNTEAASAVLAALQHEGKELPLSVLLQLKQLQQRLTEADKGSVDGLNRRKDKTNNPSMAVARSGVNSSLGNEVLPLYAVHTHVPPPISGVPNPFESDDHDKHGNSEYSNSNMMQTKMDSGKNNGKKSQVAMAPVFSKSDEDEEKVPDTDKMEQQQQQQELLPQCVGGGGGGKGITTPDSTTTNTTSTTTTTTTTTTATTPVPNMTRHENTEFNSFPEPEVSTRLPPGWALMYDRQRRRHYFVHTDTTTGAVKTTWTHPNGAADQMDLEQQVENWYKRQQERRQGTAITPTTTTTTTTVPTTTLTGWEECIDPKSGRKYYVNRQTKETSWTLPSATPAAPPVGVNAAGVERTTGTMPMAPISSTTTTTTTPNVDEVSPLPPFWEERVDPKSGKKFYLNHQTRETTWTRPALLPLQQQQQQQQPQHQQQPVGPVAPLGGTAAVSGVSALPPFWEERVDPKSGRKFYVNHQTRETTWTRP
ncbi:WW domain [Trypanosoma melophagium]|uniref:WW domain n=1 Tax=Trypanosoma melophagium TaxID=715481 RepID=UPI00351A911F|nr:WW domain [Trypanosoma melophagium]